MTPLTPKKENKPLRAILIDDEVNCLKMLQWELNNNCPEIEIITSCETGKCGLLAIKEMKPDIVFLDIEMPYLNGFEVLELVPNIDFDVVFTTAYDKFAVRAFKSSAVDYLLKPIEGDELRVAVDKILKNRKEKLNVVNLEFLLSQLEASNKSQIKKVALPTFEGFTFVPLKNIVYCQSDNNYCNIVLKEGRKLLISKTLKDVEEMLDPDVFFRVHNSFLVNTSEITNYHKTAGGYLIMSNNDKVRVSRSRKDDLLSRLI